MSITAATASLVTLGDRWEAIIPSATCVGINGDVDHQDKPGKHLSRSDNIKKFGSSAWPVVHAKDKEGPADKACAIDIRMDTADLIKVHKRFVTVYQNRAIDPRAKYLYAFNGWDGTGDAGRYNLVKGTVETTDDSHKWHGHYETFYKYVNDPNMVDAFISIARGDDMPLSDADVTKVTDAVYDRIMNTRFNETKNSDGSYAWPTLRVVIANLFQQASGHNGGQFDDWITTLQGRVTISRLDQLVGTMPAFDEVKTQIRGLETKLDALIAALEDEEDA